MDEAGDEVTIPDEVLRRALQFAVDIAVQRHHARPRQAYPPALRGLLRKSALSGRDLAVVRQALAADAEFRGAVAAKASPDLVDEVGRIYLAGGSDWVAELTAALGADASSVEALTRRLTAEGRRREAAEAAAQSVRAESERAMARAVAERDELAAAAAELDRRLAGALDELTDLRRGLDEARVVIADLQRAGEQRAAEVASRATEVERLGAELDALRVELGDAHAVRDAALITRSNAHRLAEADEDPWHAGLVERTELRRRTPLAVPGGLLASSAQATEFLLRAGEAMVLVDGYNLAKRVWPELTLERQRERTIELFESLASRWGTDVAVVFDGASVVGASAPRRRKILVEFSAEGVIADDVIVRWVERLDPQIAVIVVTDDAELGRRVRRLGANVVGVGPVADVALR